MEARMLQIASADEVKMAQMQEIYSWFATKSELHKAVMLIALKLTVKEDERLTSQGLPKRPVEIVLWAMEEAESADRKQARKWREFRSRRCIPTGPTEFEVGVVMALPSPGTREMPILIEDGEPRARVNKSKEVVYTPRRSPCFPWCSPRLLGLAHSAAAE